MTKGFYMVWVEGEPQPTVKHETRETAAEEAKRLAEKEMKMVYILRAEYSYSPEVRIASDYLLMP